MGLSPEMGGCHPFQEVLLAPLLLLPTLLLILSWALLQGVPGLRLSWPVGSESPSFPHARSLPRGGVQSLDQQSRVHRVGPASVFQVNVDDAPSQCLYLKGLCCSLRPWFQEGSSLQGTAFSLRPPLCPHPWLKGPDSEAWPHRRLPQHRAEETTPKPPPSHPQPFPVPPCSLFLASRKEPWGQPGTVLHLTN